MTTQFTPAAAEDFHFSAQGFACLQGNVDVSYAQLVKVFGKPHSKGDGYKVDAEWRLKFSDGTVAAIYNYKDGKNYAGKHGLPVSKIRDWHVGGFTREALNRVIAALQAAA